MFEDKKFKEFGQDKKVRVSFYVRVSTLLEREDFIGLLIALSGECLDHFLKKVLGNIKKRKFPLKLQIWYLFEEKRIHA